MYRNHNTYDGGGINKITKCKDLLRGKNLDWSLNEGKLIDEGSEK